MSLCSITTLIVPACMADNDLSERRLIGLADWHWLWFGRNNLGRRGALGFVALALKRFAHLDICPCPAATRLYAIPWRIAVGYAQALNLDIEGLPFLQRIGRQAVAMRSSSRWRSG